MRYIVVLLLIVLAGCATPPRQMSRDEWLSVTTRDYSGVSKDQALAAAERLFRLADGDDFQISHTEDGLQATRHWTVYLVLAGAMGDDHWDVRAQPQGDGVRMRVHLATNSAAVTAIPVAPNVTAPFTSPAIGTGVNGTAIYDVFWSRMDYLLGKRSDWMTCQQADERVKTGAVWGVNEALCNAFNVKDQSPG